MVVLWHEKQALVSGQQRGTLMTRPRKNIMTVMLVLAWSIAPETTIILFNLHFRGLICYPSFRKEFQGNFCNSTKLLGLSLSQIYLFLFIYKSQVEWSKDELCGMLNLEYGLAGGRCNPHYQSCYKQKMQWTVIGLPDFSAKQSTFTLQSTKENTSNKKKE